MNDAEKIEQGAIVDARGDYEAINEWLEKLKEKVNSFELKSPGNIYGGLALFSLGYFLGIRSDRRISWLLQCLSGAAFGYSTVQFIGEFNRRNEPKKEEGEPKKLENVHIVSDEQ